jgi:hypothetical protein
MSTYHAGAEIRVATSLRGRRHLGRLRKTDDVLDRVHLQVLSTRL